MYRLHLSLQFLRHHWLMSLIGSFFVGTSLVILVVVMAVMDGFQQRLTDTVAGFSADYILVPRTQGDFGKLSVAVEENVEGVVAAGPFHETVTLIQRGGPTNPLRDKLEFAQVYGVDGWREQRINRFGEYIAGEGGVRDLREPFKIYDRLAEKSGTKGVILGFGLQQTLGVRVGDKVKLASIRRKQGTNPESTESADFDIKWLRYPVVGIYRSGNHEKDARCLFLEHTVVEELWSADVRRSGVRAKLGPGATFASAKASTQRVFPTLMAAAGAPPAPVEETIGTLGSWKDENPTLMSAIESEKSMILVIAFLIVIAGTSSIFAAQWLLVSDKIREIGILRALGAGIEGVMSVFVFNGLLMGIIGSASGAVLGLVVVKNIDAVAKFIGWIMGREVFPQDIYLFATIPTKVDHAAVVNYSLAALACTLVASAIPALRAGLMDPAKALHRE